MLCILKFQKGFTFSIKMDLSHLWFVSNSGLSSWRMEGRGLRLERAINAQTKSQNKQLLGSDPLLQIHPSTKLPRLLVTESNGQLNKVLCKIEEKLESETLYLFMTSVILKAPARNFTNVNRSMTWLGSSETSSGRKKVRVCSENICAWTRLNKEEAICEHGPEALMCSLDQNWFQMDSSLKLSRWQTNPNLNSFWKPWKPHPPD